MTRHGAETAHHVLFGAAAGRPDRPCLLLADGRTVTYGELADRSASIATVVRDRSAAAGDRVVAQVDKSVDAVALYLACLREGLVYVPLNTAYTSTEVGAFLADARPSLFVGRPEAAAPEVPDGCETMTLGADGGGTLAAAAERAGPVTEPLVRDLSDAAAMLYTSGTTGRSKGAVLSGGNLVANARALVEAWRCETDDVFVHALPLFHVHGLFVALHCAFAVGASVRFHQRFDAGAVRADLARSTVFMGVPTHYHRLLADPDLDAEACRPMRLFTSGSAPLPAAEHDAFARRTGHRIVERYGMTETMILTTNPYDGERVAGTVGFALPGVDLRVVDDVGDPLVDAPGSVEVRGDGVFRGYWGLPEQTAASFGADGWFHTGDIGSLDTDGRLTLVGRASDLIISGGYNVYPKEIEAVLDSVTGVDETAVVGVPDADLGEAVVAVVVLRPGAAVDEDLLHAACEGVLARFKHPRRYVWADRLPRNAMGKVQKAVLRERLAMSGSSDRGGRTEDSS